MTNVWLLTDEEYEEVYRASHQTVLTHNLLKAQNAKTIKGITDDLCPIIYFIDQELTKGRYKDLLLTVKSMLHDYIAILKLG